ncbi:MAG: GNAT family N-acetyltransferase [Bacteroidota bacterium]
MKAYNSKIRAYKEDDWNSIHDIFSKAKPDEFKGSVGKEDIIPLDKDRDILKLFRDSVIYVAERDDRIIGFVGYKKYLISFLFTSPDCYRQKIATRMLEYILPLIGDKAWLLVLKTNLPAIELYSKFGFTIAEEFAGKYNRKIDVTVLRLAIKPSLESWKQN